MTFLRNLMSTRQVNNNLFTPVSFPKGTIEQKEFPKPCSSLYWY